jgi:hypothetical protein
MDRSGPGTGAMAGLVGVIRHRWPTWLALVAVAVVVGDGGPAPTDALTWIMLVLPLLYLVIGAVRGHLRRPRVLLAQLAALVAYGALTALALSADDDLRRYLVAGGWLAHAAWDAVHHRANLVVPRAYAEFCGVVDLLLAAAILFLT